MEVNPQMKKTIFLLWVIMVPAGMWFTFYAYPPHSFGNGIDLLALGLLTAVIASMPIMINNMPIFLTQWVTFFLFLKFGLFVEMVFAQFAVLVLLVRLKVSKEQFFRYPLNSIMFFVVSLLSGIFYYQFGGHTSPNLEIDIRSFWLAALYAVFSYFLNQVFMSVNLYFIYKSKEPYFGKDFFVETVTTFITFPLGFVFYILYNHVGTLALLFVGVPFISLSIIFNLYYRSQRVNEDLKMAAEIGHQMAERLVVNDVMNLFMQRLSEMLPVDYAYILERSGDELNLLRRFEAGEVLPNHVTIVKKSEGIGGKTWTSQKSLLFSTKKSWSQYSIGAIPEDAESIISVPIVRSKRIMGVLILASKRKRAYEKFQLTIVDILCSYFAVALENAKHYERTKIQSERCPLTKLYNYRYFESLLTREFEKLKRLERKSISLIILDIDHFKGINDTYGHQSGNEILIDLANRVNKLVSPSRGTVARYGGEEFVVLMPDSSKQEAYQLAEQMRESIANWPFMLNQSIDQKQQQVRITASIGVATAPEDADDAVSLIRHADRALYVGAKRAGRNRVAEYSSS